MLSRDGYLAEWSRLHDGVDPRANSLVHGWLTMTYALASRIARIPLSPNAITGSGVVTAFAAVGVSTLGGWWLLLAAALVVKVGVLDSLDGAVAVLTGRVTSLGRALDAVADRIGEALFVAVLWLAGAPSWLCVAGLVPAYLLEFLRVRAGEVGPITVFERPTRIIVTAMFATAAAVVGSPWALLGAGAWVVLGLVGLSQWVVARRRD